MKPLRWCSRSWPGCAATLRDRDHARTFSARSAGRALHGLGPTFAIVTATQTDPGRVALASILDRHRAAITDAATDWVIAQALDLRGQRPREETHRLVTRVVAWNEALLLHADDRPLNEFIQLVTTLRASSEFRVSTLLRGFVSFRKALPRWLTPPDVELDTALAVLQLVDDAYFAAIFRMTDEYVQKLNHTVIERRQVLEHELAELTAQRLQELDHARRIIDQQEESLNRVSLPILQVWDGVLVLPLIGELTSARAAALIQRMLSAVVEKRARLAILDVTALPTMGEQTAALLSRTMQAIQVIGARGMIVGMSPEVAGEVTKLQVDLSGVRTYRTLADGLLAAQQDRLSSFATSQPRQPRKSS